ncbi:MAG TPA: molybdopterin-binding protein, partial [bacterium]|nr:molybdopterin-binding protein [bacterium]
VEPDNTPGPAQIRNSNAWQLLAQVRSLGIEPCYSGILPDREDITSAAIDTAAKSSDVLLLSGGVSAGDYDLVPDILRKLGFLFAFDSVAMQPGRPTIFAHKEQVYVCGLPGNPVSTFINFELLIRPFLYRLMGHDWQPLVVEARLAEAIRRKQTSRQSTVPVRFVTPSEVAPVEYHGSAHIHALTRASGLVTIPVGQACLQKGDVVRVRSLSS